ncbi:PREDICTED: lysyl oxidase homolog 3-like, partial [Nanorana parkeri]|uniref:lysyl oxidase homolog 3-like n=1 Tax=Nanorana parkeri TaxID=125878 RepID=UPI0008543B3A
MTTRPPSFLPEFHPFHACPLGALTTIEERVVGPVESWQLLSLTRNPLSSDSWIMYDLSASLWVLCTLSAIVPGWTQQTTPPTSGLKFRLAGFPRKHNEGRIEVFYSQEWGTICDDDFTMENAHILCRHLGFTEATGWTHSAKYGKGIGRIWLDNVICSGSEKSITDCISRGWGSTDCTHEEDAGVICKDERIPGYVEPNTIETEQRQVEEVHLRPVISSAKNRLPIHEGILEIKYKNSWEHVCDVGWTQTNSHVVCGMLGFPSEKKYNQNFYKSSPSQEPKKKELKNGNRLYMGRQKPSFRVHSVKCGGTEVHLSLCPFEFYKENSTDACQDGAPVVISCTVGPAFVGHGTPAQATMKKKKVSQQQREEIIRLKGGSRPGKCDSRLGWPASFTHGLVLFHRLYMGRQKPSFRVHSVKCGGTEVHLSLCPFEFYKENSTDACQDGAPVVISCTVGPAFVGHGTPAQATMKKKKVSQQQREEIIRLKGGSRPGEGRVEVLRKGEWGTVCDDRWDLQAASVVCRQLGFGSAKEALTGARMGQGMGPIHMNEVRCTGPEDSLFDCQYKNITQEDCKHSEDASVKCNIPYMGYENTIRIVGGRTQYEGRVELKRGTSWGYLCSDGWTTKEAMVACRQLGLGYSLHAITETWYWDASNVTEMVLSGVRCSGSEMSLQQCSHHRAVSCKNTGTRHAAGVICSE